MSQDAPHLQHALSMRQFFMLAFGAMIGVGWMIVAGAWINGAGPGGAMLGIIGGGLMIIAVALSYAELGGMYPVSGGEAAYAYEIYGPTPAFVIAWFLALAYGVIIPFEFVAVGWIFVTLAPSLEGPKLYALLGHDIHLGAVIVGFISALVIGLANYRGVKSAARLQDALTFSLMAVTIAFVGVSVVNGDPENLEPIFAVDEKGSVFATFAAVLITTPLWFAGFDTVAQAMGEKSDDAATKRLGMVLALAIGGAILFYCAVIFATAMAVPRAELLVMDFPVAGAVEAVFADPLGARLVLLAGFLGLLTSWNAVFLGTTRLIYAMGRARMIPSAFGAVHPIHLTPANAIIFVLILGVAGGLLGRGAIDPIIDVGAGIYTLVFLSMCVGVIILRLRAPNALRPYRAPSIAAPVIGAAAMAWLFWLSLRGDMARLMEGETPFEWAVLALWGALGLLLWIVAAPMRARVGRNAVRRMILEQDNGPVVS